MPDGLVHARVWAVHQDRDGYLWLGTDGGVGRFDGQSLVAVAGQDATHPALRVVYAIHQDRRGDVWFGGPGGASRYDGTTFTTLTTADGLADPLVNAIVSDRDGAVWFGTRRGATRYDGDTFVTFTTADGLADDWVETIVVDDDGGTLWFGTRGGVSRYDGRTWVTYTTGDGLVHDWVRAMARDRDGMLWIGTQAGVSRFDGESFATVTMADGWLDQSVRPIYRDAEGTLWLGSQSESRGGVVRYDGETFRVLTTRDGLADVYVHAITQDREGHLWFGTDAGLNAYAGTAWTTFTADDGLVDNDTWSLARDTAGRVWIGTRNGVSRFDGTAFTTFTTANGLADNVAYRLFGDRQGNVWVGSWSGGVSRFDGRAWTRFGPEDGLPLRAVQEFRQDRDGGVWIVGAGGASRWDGRTFATLTTDDGLPQSGVLSVLEDHAGILWFGTRRGVSRYDGHRFVTFTTADGLADDRVRAMVEDRDGNVWFATAGGVSRYDGAHWSSYTSADGLAHNDVAAIARDARGDLWFATAGGGVSRYDGRVFATLTTGDGLAHDDVRAIMTDPDGSLWFATVGGVTRYRPPPRVPPPIFIDAVVADRRYEGAVDVGVPSTVGVTTLLFHGISFKTRPDAVTYRYRLTGHDPTWRTTHERRVEYQNLPRGSYVFEVQAVDRDLVYSTRTATVRLTVHLPYAQVALLSALGLAAVLVAWQTARVVQRGRRLALANRALETRTVELAEARAVADRASSAKSRFLANMSHEIRTPLNAILGYAQILRRDPEVPPSHGRALDTIARSGDHLLRVINEVLDLSRIEAGALELHTTDFDLQALLRGMDDMFRLSCEQRGIAWHVERPAVERCWVHGDEGKLTEVLTNLLGNAVKFTDRGGIRLDVVAGPEDRYRFAVIDTGPGLPPGADDVIFDPFGQTETGARRGGTGLGLTIARRLVELMGGALTVDSTPSGSRFAFSLPLPPGRAAGAHRRWSRVRGLADGHRVAALVADDIQENREVLSRMLTDIGVDVTVTANGLEAIRHLQHGAPDIALLDVYMPGMDGPQVARWIRDHGGPQRMKIVAVSASVLRQERERILAAGFDRFLPKPVRAEELYACLAELCHVEFVEAPDDRDAAADVEPDWGRVRLSSAMLARLTAAAEAQSVTDLDRCLLEVEALGTGEARVAARLRALVARYDMRGIRDVLGRLARV